MKHPLIYNTKYLMLYGIFWFLIAGASAAIQWNYYDMPLDVSLISPLTQYLLFAALALSIWYVVKYNPVEANSWWKLVFFHIIASSVLILIWVFISNVIINMITPNLNELMTMSLPTRILSGYIMYVFYVFFFMSIVYYENFKEKVKKEGELKALIREAELHALKSQINPHFLFNSLNSISSLTMSDPAKAQEMVINLSSLMRYSLKHGQNETVSFGTELQNIKLYLSIEKVRFGRKLQPVFKVDEHCYQGVIPNMILQPIFENAIKYGVYEATEPVEILTEATCSNDALEISVTNSYDPGVRSKKGEGIGLRNIRERLQIIYGNSALLKIKDNRKNFTITLTIPQKNTLS
ncbi:MAG TPA: histidine kinase [Prolixibacteraceae bacterium]|mgnify:CR=1 FL=1|nr:histidine kinase [Prolixibacteraceae bacterium]HPT31613.1 histidine kinase [Prolixibacteraceae bacterium]